MVIERFEVDSTIDVNATVVGDGVTKRSTVIKLCSSLPGIGGGVLGIGLDPVEDGNLIEWGLIAGREVLVVVERRSPVLEAGPHGVFPSLVCIGVEVFVHGCVGFLYLCSCGR